MRNATRRNSGRRRRSELLGFEARPRAAVYDRRGGGRRRGPAVRSKSMMDKQQANQGVVVYAGLGDVTIQPELCYGGAVADEGPGPVVNSWRRASSLLRLES
jgi:hypothetical protein